jgi:iron complex outermembrane receptor protein
VELTVGNYETVNGGGFISGPLGKDLSGRISFSLQHHSGYGQNLVTGSDIDGQEFASRSRTVIVENNR